VGFRQARLIGVPGANHRGHHQWPGYHHHNRSGTLGLALSAPVCAFVSVRECVSVRVCVCVSVFGGVSACSNCGYLFLGPFAWVFTMIFPCIQESGGAYAPPGGVHVAKWGQEGGFGEDSREGAEGSCAHGIYGIACRGWTHQVTVGKRGK
jgi:hypothetical protein